MQFNSFKNTSVIEKKSLEILKKTIFKKDILFLLLAVILPWSSAISNVLIFIILAYFIGKSIKNRIKLAKELKTGLFLLLLFLIVNVFSVIQSPDSFLGIDYLKRVSLLFFLPFAINLGFNINSFKDKYRVLRLFGHSTFLLSLFTLISAIFKWFFYYQNLPIENYTTYEGLSRSLVNHQAIYFSLYVGFAIIVLFKCLLHRIKENESIGLLIMELVFLFCFIFLLGARMAILSTFICLLIMGLAFSKRVFLLLCLLGVLLFMGNYSFNNSFKNRINHVLNFSSDFEFSKNWSYEGLALRYMTWNCSVEVIKKNFWMGTGIVQSQEHLDKCYENNSYQSLIYFKKNNGTRFNSHSLFLEVFVKTGIIGFAILASIFLYYVFFAIKNSNFLLLIFLIYFILNGISESLFIREKGILFFAFFLGILSMIEMGSKLEKRK